MTSIFDLDVSRTLSVSLFKDIKPICVRLSQFTASGTFNPDSDDLISTLNELNNAVWEHHRKNTADGQLYYLTPNLADYVFFPVSGLLKQQNLNEIIRLHVLDIISFLVVYSWVPNHQLSDTLVGQLLPVILYLIKGKETDINKLMKGRSDDAKVIYNKVLWSIIRHVDDYFTNGDYKRLSMLGDVSSVMLALLQSSTYKSQEDHEAINGILQTLRGLFVKSITSDQLSRILPGTVSTIINFCISSKNIDYRLLTQIIDLLRELIIRVFNDETLKVEVKSKKLELADLNEQWLKAKDSEVDDTSSISVSLHNGEDLNEAWLKATSNKLKLSLNAFFKAILYENTNRGRINKQSVVETIGRFSRDILQYCFWSLFDQFVPLSIDILAFLCHSTCFPDHGRLEYTDRQETLRSHVDDLYYVIIDHDQKLYEKVLISKLEDLIEVKLGSIMKSSSEDRIIHFLVALEFHFVLLKRISSKEVVDNLVQRLIICLKSTLADASFLTGKKSTGKKKEFIRSYQGITEDFETENKLDDVQLPPYVNAESITKFDQSKQPQSKAELTSDLVYLSKTWSNYELQQESETRYFEESLSKDVEVQLEELIQFLGQISDNGMDILEAILLGSNHNLERGIGLWISNNFLKKKKKEAFDIDEFLDFGEGEAEETKEEDDEEEEIKYLLVLQSQTLIQEVSPTLSNLTLITRSEEARNQMKVNEKSYAMALDSIGVLAGQLPIEEFKEVVLIEYLFSIFEALTFNSTHIQTHARNAVMVIANKYYGGSLAKLIGDNSDYLVDSLSLKLSVPGSLTPSIPGILLIVLKVSGLDLLFNNQLSDLIAQIFTLIDSYHGYSVLVAGFFVLFDELIAQLTTKYDLSGDNRLDTPVSLYKPWGMINMDQVHKLVDDSSKIVDAFEGYDANKKYFRKADVPFSELPDSDDEEEHLDSDDEEVEGQGSEATAEQNEDKEDKWECLIPKNIYMIVQQVFIYGLRLLSHPSDGLKIQLLTTMTELYPLISTNYPFVLPIVADNWSEIMGLFSRSICGPSSDEVAVKALTFLKLIVETDRQHQDTFFGKRFIVSSNAILERFQATRQSTELVKVKTFKNGSSARLSESLTGYLISGLNNYERLIPDITALRIMKLVRSLGTKPINYGPQARNIEWVLKTLEV